MEQQELVGRGQDSETENNAFKNEKELISDLTENLRIVFDPTIKEIIDFILKLQNL